MDKINNFYFLKLVIILQFIPNFILLIRLFKNHSSEKIENNNEYNNHEKIEELDLDIFNSFSGKDSRIQMDKKDQRFLHGLIRKYKPNKLVEIGVASGGSSALILNAIKDLPSSKLYSIDKYKMRQKEPSKKVGWIVEKNFPKLINKWTLFTGKNPSEYLEIIGNNIDFAFIDTIHYTPGEMFNWLEVLPFLKEEAIVVFHDVFLMFKDLKQLKKAKKNYSNNQLLCYIRGRMILPSYNKNNNLFSRNIGALKLDKNQKKYYKHYFVALGNEWSYIPNKNDLKILRKYFIKYYGGELVEIFDNAVQKNMEKFNLTIDNV